VSEELVFKMGQFAARFPTDRLYARNHMWGQPCEGGIRFGFSAYAVRLLQDVYFLDWIVEPGDSIQQRQQIGSIESSKAESDLYAPITGTVAQLNEELLSDPSHINVHTYGQGWLFVIRGNSDPQEGSGEQGTRNVLISPEEYLEHLAASWDVAQRTIKGQIN